MPRRVAVRQAVVLALSLSLILAGCALPPLPRSTPSTMSASQPPAVAYNLGDAVLVQSQFPEGNRFRNMPVRLNGLIAAPAGQGGPHPVVVILHGTHPGCPMGEGEADLWPCAPEEERPNYSGFDYLARELAARGYVVIAPNINAENTFGFGEPVFGRRAAQLLDLHLQALARAAAGGANHFGVALTGRADLARLTLFGHSRGGELAWLLANDPTFASGDNGYGPVRGVLQIAAATSATDPWHKSVVPFATILAACDGDVVTQDGQFFFEGARLAPDQTTWAASAWLEGANHNSFNALLRPEGLALTERRDCADRLAPAVQRGWLVRYAADFLAVLFDADTAATVRVGMDVRTPAPAKLYNLPARMAFLAPAADRQMLWLPANPQEMSTHRLGGAVIADNVVTHFCPKGFYTPQSLPGYEPCHRHVVTVPGQPSHAVVAWEQRGGEVRFTLPAEAGDLSGDAAISLRAAVDPASPLNPVGQAQALSVRLTDHQGNSASITADAAEPALRFPPGVLQANGVYKEGAFTGRVPLTALRIPLSRFSGINLTEVAEVALVFDQTDSGAIFLADLEWVQPFRP
jgi:dienelactone hydrolase